MAIPPLPVSNRSLAIGTVVFLFLSAVYKSGIIGWALRMKYSQKVNIPASHEVLIKEVSVWNSLEPRLTVVPDLAMVEEMSNLRSKLSIMASRGTEFDHMCWPHEEERENQISTLALDLERTNARLHNEAKARRHDLEKYEDSLAELDIEQIRVMDKIDNDYNRQLTTISSAHEIQLNEMQNRVSSLTHMNIALKMEMEQRVTQIKADADLALSEQVRLREEAENRESIFVEVPVPATPADLSDMSLLRSYVTVTLLTLIATAFGLATAVLLMERKKLIEESQPPEPIRIFESVYTPAASPDIPVQMQDDSVADSAEATEEEARISMAVEDMKAAIAREVQAQVEIIEAHHERELQRMKAIIKETNSLSIELGGFMKELEDDTVLASTTINSPTSDRDYDLSHDNVSGGPTPSPSRKASEDDPRELSALSMLLETSVTPIRVPLGSRSETVKQPGSSVPTCYSIASPSRRERERLSKDSSSEEDDSDEKENINDDMAVIWNNFNQGGASSK